MFTPRRSSSSSSASPSAPPPPPPPPSPPPDAAFVAYLSRVRGAAQHMWPPNNVSRAALRQVRRRRARHSAILPPMLPRLHANYWQCSRMHRLTRHLLAIVADRRQLDAPRRRRQPRRRRRVALCRRHVHLDNSAQRRDMGALGASPASYDARAARFHQARRRSRRPTLSPSTSTTRARAVLRRGRRPSATARTAWCGE